MDDVYIVEIAATGPRGMPNDTVAQVAVCRMYADGSDYDTVFEGHLALDPKDLGKDSLDFLESEYGITAEDLYAGDDPKTVVERFQSLVFGRECTSYDVKWTFGKFLCFEPWDTTRELTLLPSYSVRLDRSIREPEEGKNPIRKAYEATCPGDPLSVGPGNGAFELAQMSAGVMMELRKAGYF